MAFLLVRSRKYEDSKGHSSYEKLRVYGTSSLAALSLFLSILPLPVWAEGLRNPEGRQPFAANGPREIPRRILVLYGWDEEHSEKPRTWPVDTVVGELLQAPLEWLGYEVEYLNLGKSPLPPQLPERFAGVIIDGEVDIPTLREQEVAGWLLAARKQGALLLFTGGFPFTREEVIQDLTNSLGLRGTCAKVENPSEVAINAAAEGVANFEAKAEPRGSDFLNLAAPESARVLLSLKARDVEGTRVRFDPIFLTSWGGMWLEPYLIRRASADSSPFYADPYRLLAEWLKPNGVFPAPDTSTREGRRIFYSHIDGDGFASLSQFKGHPLCAELVRDRILKVFPFPITVSIIESELRGESAGMSKEQPFVQEVAKEIFSLPNVQAASHSYSHPYIWEPLDPNPGRYDEPCLAMKVEPKFPALDLAKEIPGSVKYINETLLPPGKRCELFLWSGNCRPGPAALRTVREMGLENLNGGNTIISRMYPGLAGIAPRTMEWDGELQVNASNQNEFMYANGFNGPFYGGFADVIDTFELTESPRRVKPVNVYYHFYSATYLSSLRALEKIHHWAAEQKLHNITALEFVKLTKDARETRVIALGPGHWRFVNGGSLRTFRLPATLGVPDIARSRGITGWTRHEDQIYIHTDGKAETELVLVNAEKATPHPYLEQSSAEVRWLKFSAAQLDVEVKDLRPVELVFAGLAKQSTCTLSINGRDEQHVTDAAGRLRLTLPAQARIRLSLPTVHAAR
ncbi:hypothetical protein DES53_101314 [Roseimicrobium gellanilyticum]|uniref:Uncharacterized protein n=1 Tax=Roseimicrobium gellanilyticum TaxID=748857 RepID=A0A366HTV3_9BACT|nr:hypothetical protein [Roseimicrobium gellanilyticum]RBP47517.1 hypothetical protein DES53_101314 [Roseimicrobium gellanilyticum]